MLRYIIISIFILCNTHSVCAQESLEISLLTCSPGPEIYSTFGHSAIRIKDTLRGIDHVYDYGTFNFNTPNFTLKFIKGDLEYRLSKSSFNQFLETYALEGKGVIEEKLIITTGDKTRFYELLKENYKPENRYYRYDFFFDNCSTRIRDVIESLDSVSYAEEDVMTRKTFKDGLNEHFSNKKWLGLGINLVLGQSADKIMTYRQQMFLPKYLSKNLSSYTNTTTNASILGTPKALLPSRFALETSNTIKVRPFLCFSLFFFVTLVACFRKPRWLVIITPIVYFILGFSGCFLVFLWLGTSHHATYFNWNILWANPLYLALLFIKHPKIKRYILVSLSVLTLVVLLSWAIIPQYIHPVFMLLLVTVSILNAFSIYKKV